MLTPEAFDFVFTNELKRASRSHNFVTLLLLEPSYGGTARNPDIDSSQLARQVAGVIGNELRETDLLTERQQGQLSIVLLDSDLQASMRVVDRLMARLEHCSFADPVVIQVGAACCPTHGADAHTLRRAAAARAIRSPQSDARA